MKTFWKYVPVALLFSLPVAHLSAQEMDELSARIVTLLEKAPSDNADSQRNVVKHFIEYELGPLKSDIRGMFNAARLQCWEGKRAKDGKNVRSVNFAKIEDLLDALQVEPTSPPSAGDLRSPSDLKTEWDRLSVQDPSLLFLTGEDHELIYLYSGTGFGKDRMMVLPSCREPPPGQENLSVPPRHSLACLSKWSGPGVESSECAGDANLSDSARRNRLVQSQELRLLILAFLARDLEDYTTTGLHSEEERTRLKPVEWALKWRLKGDVSEWNLDSSEIPEPPCDDILALYGRVRCR
jgi:hypothetical protein